LSNGVDISRIYLKTYQQNGCVLGRDGGKCAVRCPDKKTNSSDLDLVAEESMEMVLYALPTFLLLLLSTITCHTTHRSLETCYAETAKFVSQLEAHLQAPSVEQFTGNYDIFEPVM
jgi:hypothetical protein